MSRTACSTSSSRLWSKSSIRRRLTYKKRMRSWAWWRSNKRGCNRL